MAYAEKTTVSVARTKANIEELVQTHGAEQFVSGYKANMAVIGFTMSGRQIRFLLPLPDKSAKEFWYTPGRGQRRADDAAHTAWEQACRSRWRALYLIVKAKLEAVEAGISTVEREFLYDIVLPDGRGRCQQCCRCWKIKVLRRKEWQSAVNKQRICVYVEIVQL